MELTDRELQVITQGATNAYNAQRKFMDLGDLINEAVVWALTHEKKLLMWREKGKHGENLLRFSAKQHCLSLIGKERRRIYVLEKDDIAYYTPAIVREVPRMIRSGCRVRPDQARATLASPPWSM